MRNGVSLSAATNCSSTGCNADLSCATDESLNEPSFEEMAARHSLALSPSRFAANLTRAATPGQSVFCALRMRSTIREEKAFKAGDKLSFDVTRATKRAPSVSSSGCRLFQA